MKEQQQIEEMARAMCGNFFKDECVGGERVCDYECIYAVMANRLYKYRGYRKQNEGEWIYHECVSSYDGAKSGYSCSCCSGFVDENIFDMDELHKAYCGSCGAKMKGVSKDERTG